jgi:hypothetical protein
LKEFEEPLVWNEGPIPPKYDELFAAMDQQISLLDKEKLECAASLPNMRFDLSDLEGAEIEARRMLEDAERASVELVSAKLGGTGEMELYFRNFELQKEKIIRQSEEMALALEHQEDEFHEIIREAEKETIIEIQKIIEASGIEADEKNLEHHQLIYNVKLHHEMQMEVLWKMAAEFRNEIIENRRIFTTEYERIESEQESGLSESAYWSEQALDHQRSEREEFIAELDETLEKCTNKMRSMRDMALSDEMREQDLVTIERLENKLALLTEYLIEMLQDIDAYKEQIVIQEEGYQQRFGGGPNVAVFRPKTPVSGRATGKSPKPSTAKISVRPSTSLLRNRRSTAF